MTSALSTRRMHDLGESVGRGKGKARVDQGAAIALLESWLLKLSYDRRRAEEAALAPEEGATEPGTPEPDGSGPAN